MKNFKTFLNENINDSNIFIEIETLIENRKKELVKYINESFTQKEREEHGQNIIDLFIDSGDIAEIKIKLQK